MKKQFNIVKKNKIGVEAWSPLGSGACLNNPKIQEIANKYQKIIGTNYFKMVITKRYCYIT